MSGYVTPVVHLWAHALSSFCVDPTGSRHDFLESKGWLCPGFADGPQRCPILTGILLGPKEPIGGLQPVGLHACCVQFMLCFKFLR